jgi:hypothetical protein
MAKIIGSASFNGSVSKLVELPDEYIINGQVYDKSSFGPKPLDFCPMYVSGNCEPILSQTVVVDPSWMLHNKTKNAVLIDSNDPSICYVAQIGAYNAIPNITKLRRTVMGLETTVIAPYNYAPSYEFISQSTDRIYVLSNRYQENGNGTAMIFAINKTTMAIEIPATLNYYSRVKILKDTPGFIYFTQSYTSNAFYIMKYNKVTAAVTMLIDDSKGGYNVPQIGTDVKMSGNTMTFFGVRDGFWKDTTKGYHWNCFRKYTVNLDTDISTAADVTLDTTVIGTGNVFAVISDSNNGISYEMFTHVDNGKNYVTLVIYNVGPAINITAGRSAMYTFEMIDDDNWKLVSYRKFTPFIPKGMLTLYSNKLLILADDNTLNFFNWNTNTQTFERTAQFPMAVKIFGIDMNNNIWVQKSDRSIEIFSNTVPMEIYADYILDDYAYDGTDISSNIQVYARNYTGQYLTNTIQLTLTGPVKFTDTGLKTKTVTTSNLNPITVPVTIYGQGLLNVNVKLM